MTGISGSAGGRLVFDTMCLNHFALAERLDVLRDLVIDRECWTTGVVVEELRQGATEHPLLSGTVALDWINIIQLDTLDEIRCFVKWTRLIGSGSRDLGEASVLAAAELRGAVALTDDREAVRVARAHGAQVHGTVWLLAGACRDGKLTLVGGGESDRGSAVNWAKTAVHWRGVPAVRPAAWTAVGTGEYAAVGIGTLRRYTEHHRTVKYLVSGVVDDRADCPALLLGWFPLRQVQQEWSRREVRRVLDVLRALGHPCP